MKKVIEEPSKKKIHEEVKRVISSLPEGWSIALFVYNSQERRALYDVTGDMEDAVDMLVAFLGHKLVE